MAGAWRQWIEKGSLPPTDVISAKELVEMSRSADRYEEMQKYLETEPHGDTAVIRGLLFHSWCCHMPEERRMDFGSDVSLCALKWTLKVCQQEFNEQISTTRADAAVDTCSDNRLEQLDILEYLHRAAHMYLTLVKKITPAPPMSEDDIENLHKWLKEQAVFMQSETMQQHARECLHASYISLIAVKKSGFSTIFDALCHEESEDVNAIETESNIPVGDIVLCPPGLTVSRRYTTIAHLHIYAEAIFCELQITIPIYTHHDFYKISPGGFVFDIDESIYIYGIDDKLYGPVDDAAHAILVYESMFNEPRELRTGSG
jgi:hypothetical protein